MFWGGLALGAALIIYFIAREFVPETWFRKPREKTGVTDWRPDTEQARVYRVRITMPYLLMGWCWFLGTLVPVIGIIQVGSQPYADRYMYVPAIGLFVMVAWGAHHVAVMPDCHLG